MEIIEKAPAKLNLALDVLSKRADGYHELDMIMTSVDLADKLSVIPLNEDRVVIKTNNSFLPVDKRNHVFQAATLLKQRYQITTGVQINLQKKIPVAAGLGGGSTDAAAVLRAMNRLFGLECSLAELAEIGGKVGTDVPFCVYGKTARVTGWGNQVTPIASLPPYWVVLVKPKVSVSTPKIFAATQVEKLSHPQIENVQKGIERKDYSLMISGMANSLESVTIEKYPIVAEIKKKMYDFGADIALMSGSGPTLFALTDKQSKAERMANSLRGFCEEVYVVRTMG